MIPSRPTDDDVPGKHPIVGVPTASRSNSSTALRACAVAATTARISSVRHMRPSRKLTAGVAAGNTSVMPAAKYPLSVMSVIPLIELAAALQRNTSG